MSTTRTTYQNIRTGIAICRLNSSAGQKSRGCKKDHFSLEARIKICTGTFDTFGTFFQKVKNARDLGTACLHFDTSNKTQSYQKDRKCQKC